MSGCVFGVVVEGVSVGAAASEFVGVRPAEADQVAVDSASEWVSFGVVGRPVASSVWSGERIRRSVGRVGWSRCDSQFSLGSTCESPYVQA